MNSITWRFGPTTTWIQSPWGCQVLSYHYMNLITGRMSSFVIQLHDLNHWEDVKFNPTTTCTQSLGKCQVLSYCGMEYRMLSRAQCCCGLTCACGVCCDCAGASLETGRFEWQALSSGPGAQTLWTCVAKNLMAHVVLAVVCLIGDQKCAEDLCDRILYVVLPSVSGASSDDIVRCVFVCDREICIGRTKAGCQRWVGSCVKRRGRYYRQGELTQFQKFKKSPWWGWAVSVAGRLSRPADPQWVCVIWGKWLSFQAVKEEPSQTCILQGALRMRRSSSHWRKPSPSSSSSKSPSAGSSGRHQHRSPPKPQVFAGKKGDWNGFIFQFCKMARYFGWSQLEKGDRLLASLRGKAVDFITPKPREVQDEYQALKDTLEVRFGKMEPPTSARRQLSYLRQEEGETLEDYADKVMTNVSEALTRKWSRTWLRKHFYEDAITAAQLM